MSQKRHHGLTCPASGIVGYARGRETSTGAEPHQGGQVNGRVQGIRGVSPDFSHLWDGTGLRGLLSLVRPIT